MLLQQSPFCSINVLGAIFHNGSYSRAEKKPVHRKDRKHSMLNETKGLDLQHCGDQVDT